MIPVRYCDCHLCSRARAKRRAGWMLFVAVAIILAALFLSGCAGTVTPTAVESHQASFDQGEQNSGILSVSAAGYVITPHARDRYNALVADYGREFLPPIAADYGITVQGANYLMTHEALTKFITMNAWHRMGRQPRH